jgi:CHAT domain-containing protein
MRNMGQSVRHQANEAIGAGTKRASLLGSAILLSIACLTPATAQPLAGEPNPAGAAENELALARADALLEEGLDLYSRGDENAVSKTSEAWEIRRETLGESHPDTVSSLNWHAFAVRFFRSARESEPLFALTGRLTREAHGNRSSKTVESLNNYVSVLLEMGLVTEAQGFASEAVLTSEEVLSQNPYSVNTRISTYSMYAAVATALGNNDFAEPILAQALRLSREEARTDLLDLTLNIRNQYSEVLSALNRLEEAENFVSETMRMIRSEDNSSSPSLIHPLTIHARILQERDRPQEAIRSLEEAQRIARDFAGEDYRNKAALSALYASALIDLGEAERAVPVIAEARRVTRERQGERNPSALFFAGEHAKAFEMLGRNEEAAQIFDELLPLLREAFGDSHPATQSAIHSFARIRLAEGKPEEALTLARELSTASRARARKLGTWGVLGGYQNERERIGRQTREKLLADILWANSSASDQSTTKPNEEAFMALQLASSGSTSKAVAEAASLRFASRAGLGDVIEERQELDREWEYFEAELVKNRAAYRDFDTMLEQEELQEALQERLARVFTRIEALDKQIEEGVPEYFTILNQQSVSLDEVRAVLGADEAVLFLVPTKNGTHSMAVTRETILWAQSDRDENELASAVDEFRAGLEIQGSDPSLPLFDLRTAHDFYTAMIAPVEEAILNKKRVYVIADGALSRIPLGTLITLPPQGDDFTDDERLLRTAPWLADRYAMVQLPSLQSLVYIRQFAGTEGEAGETTFTGFGAPVLEGEARLRGARSATLDPVEAANLISRLRGDDGLTLMNPDALRKLASLPGTQDELEQVRKALGAPSDALFLAERMTESSIRSADLSKTRILHLATHGFTSEESGSTAEPGLVFTPPSEAKPEDDGYLAASEVVGLNLTLAEWVILSACNTASPSGKPGETGLSGLAQAFFYAGAESLLVSHWPVFDDIAPLLTVEALKRSQAGEPRAEALQAAMRTVRMDPALDAAHPAVWAPFTLVGEGR